ncbi:MAG: PEP-CTERM sorting domain-containing protein [Pseudomonadota bacterium]|jgi:hypothetical protein|nr:PEP-CTERM sorting domain-containing protein [Pseudomonadota bacterium]
MRKTTSIAAAGLLSLASMLAAGTSNASPIVFQTASGATTSGGPVSASASFALSANTLQITLADLLVNPNNVGQLLSGLSFSINGFTSGTLSSSSGQQVIVSSFGVPTYGSLGTTTGWVLQSGFDLCDICNSGKGAFAPAGLIIGPPASDGNYTDAGGSIAGNSAHNPFINQTATFNLDIMGLSAGDTVSSVLFRFGTEYGTQTSTGECTSGCGSTVPEPGALALFAAGLGALGIALSRKRWNAAHRS